MHTPLRRDIPPHVKLLFGLALLTIAVFIPLIDAGFLSLDDSYLITNNRAVLHPSMSSVRTLFTSYDPELYVPLTLLSYQVDRILFGMHPFSFHAHNILLHLLSGMLVFFVMRKLLRKDIPAFFLAGIFLLHPIQTEAVAWLSARKDLQSSFFALAAIFCALRWDVPTPDTKSFRWFIATFVFFLLALLSKVSVCILPLILLIVRSYRGYHERPHLLYHAALWLLSGVFVVVALAGKTVGLSNLHFGGTILVASQSFFFVVSKLVFPVHLRPIYILQSPVFSAAGIAGFIGLLVLLGVVVYLIRRRSTYGYSLVAFLLFLLPSVATYWKDGVVYLTSDRYIYLAIIPFFCIVLLSLAHILRYTRFTERTISLAGAVLLLALSVSTFFQSLVWRNDQTLFSYVLRHEPESHIAHTNLGNVFRGREQFNEAATHYLRAIASKPDYVPAYRNIGSLYLDAKKPKEALRYFSQAVAMSKDAPEGHYGLGVTYIRLNRFNDAERALRQALTLEPRLMDAYIALGDVYYRTGRKNQEEDIYREAIAIDPWYQPAVQNLGVILSEREKEEGR